MGREITGAKSQKQDCEGVCGTGGHLAVESPELVWVDGRRCVSRSRKGADRLIQSKGSGPKSHKKE